MAIAGRIVWLVGGVDVKAEDRGQLVRGKIAVGYWRAGCLLHVGNPCVFPELERFL